MIAEAIAAWGPAWGPLLTLLGLYWLRRPRVDPPASKADIAAAVAAFDETSMAKAVASQLDTKKHADIQVRLADNVRLNVEATLEIW